MVSQFGSYPHNSLSAVQISKKFAKKGVNYFNRSSSILWLFSDSIEMTNPRKAGSLFLVVIFGVILTPSAMTSSDPYHVQEFIKNFQNFWLTLENMFKTNDFNHSNDISENYEIIDGARYKVIFDLKLNVTNPDGGRYLIPGANEII